MIHPRPCNASSVSDGQVNLAHILFHGQLFARPGFALRIQSGAKFTLEGSSGVGKHQTPFFSH